ncbi:DUF3015 domain-containing protein [Candidatus Marinamargulisbacteria bacterium SCGC AAA071-K20]|nr:DUF3015 domain-containing protein [Candidatus Marinamargulisbacteria bacterium SCGC AAA071-K20]
MKKKLSLLLVGALLMLSAGTATARVNIWQDCGLGAMVFPDNGTAAAIVNITWDWGTTATSSKISSPGTCSSDKAQSAMFINETFESIVENTATGSGDHVTAMLDILGCDSASRDNIMTSVRSDFSKTVQGSDYTTNARTDNAEAYFNIVTSTIGNDFQGQCTAI